MISHFYLTICLGKTGFFHCMSNLQSRFSLGWYLQFRQLYRNVLEGGCSNQMEITI